MRLHVHCRFISFTLLFALLCIAGCKKKAPAVPPPQAQAPTVTTPTPEQQAPQQPTPPTTEPQTEQTAPTPTTPEQPPAPEKPSPSKPARTNRRHPATTSSTSKKPPTPPPAVPAAANPPSNAAKTPSSSDSEVGQISPDMSRTAAAQAQQSTTQLLDATEQNLHNLNRALSNDEQNVVSQIRSYIVQARNALKNQELELAHNLALKAHQLSDGLLRQ